MYDLLIIGGGASGLTAAISAAKRGRSVCILEKTDTIAKKILATGNGRCNFTNSDMKTDYYHGDRDWINTVLKDYPTEASLSYFNELGILSAEKNGYYYPYSNQAKSVVKAFEEALVTLEIPLEKNWNTASLVCDAQGFTVTNTEKRSLRGKNLLIACGLIDAKCKGLESDLFSQIKALGHTINKPLPALCGFTCKGMSFQRVAGVRHIASLKLLIDGEICGENTGEVQFTDYGLSGIPVFQLSAPASRALDLGKRVSFELNLIPGLDWEEVEGLLQKRMDQKLSPLNGLLPEKLEKEILYLYDRSAVKPYDGKLMKELLMHFTVNLDRVRDFQYAQTAAGGIPTDQIDPLTMESKIRKGLYFSGEIIDVDGICGGYNLHFAWSTGMIVGRHV